jgi:hypothetical protein
LVDVAFKVIVALIGASPPAIWVISTGTAVAVIVVAVSEPASVAMMLLLELVPPNVRIGAACAPPKLAAIRADVSNSRLMVVSSDGLSQ